jgi:uncharacterized membrane protein YtjA (UPF0391 family)
MHHSSTVDGSYRKTISSFAPDIKMRKAANDAEEGRKYVPSLLWWAVFFFILAITAWVLGARGVAGLSMTVAKWLVVIFIVLAIIALILP